jgi:hypothetical protein
MDAIIFDNIPFHLDPAALMDMLRIKASSGHVAEIERLAQAAYDIGRPKAMYTVAYIESRGEDTLATDGVVFTSRVLRVNVEGAGVSFIVTCGMELHDGSVRWTTCCNALADAIAEMALRSAMQFWRSAWSNYTSSASWRG